jgi:hypothetical protein
MSNTELTSITDKNGIHTRRHKRIAGSSESSMRRVQSLPNAPRSAMTAFIAFGDQFADDWMPDASGVLDGLYFTEDELRGRAKV